jgi:hypothetical protein
MNEVANFVNFKIATIIYNYCVLPLLFSVKLNNSICCYSISDHFEMSWFYIVHGMDLSKLLGHLWFWWAHYILL